jgi:hypothetical protein
MEWLGEFRYNDAIVFGLCCLALLVAVYLGGLLEEDD